jgi:hypothetical protein
MAHALAIKAGQAQIVQFQFVIMTVIITENALQENANATINGQELIAQKNLVLLTVIKKPVCAKKEFVIAPINFLENFVK